MSTWLCLLAKSFSSPQKSELLTGGAASQVHVPPAAFIDRQITAQPAVALLRALEAQAIGSFVQQRLDEPFGLAVGLGVKSVVHLPVGPRTSQAWRQGLER